MPSNEVFPKRIHLREMLEKPQRHEHNKLLTIKTNAAAIDIKTDENFGWGLV